MDRLRSWFWRLCDIRGGRWRNGRACQVIRAGRRRHLIRWFNGWHSFSLRILGGGLLPHRFRQRDRDGIHWSFLRGRFHFLLNSVRGWRVRGFLSRFIRGPRFIIRACSRVWLRIIGRVNRGGLVSGQLILSCGFIRQQLRLRADLLIINRCHIQDGFHGSHIRGGLDGFCLVRLHGGRQGVAHQKHAEQQGCEFFPEHDAVSSLSMYCSKTDRRTDAGRTRKTPCRFGWICCLLDTVVIIMPEKTGVKTV